MKKILILITTAIFSFSYSQNVTVSIENLKANNVTVPNGSPIDMGNNSFINVTFRVDLTKPPTYIIGPAKVWISVFNSSGNRTDYYITPVSESEFSTGASAYYDFNILDSEIDFGNGNFLMATLKQDNQPGAEWDSQQVPIIKTPSFTLSPSSVSLPCGNTDARTFTVTPSNIPSGANVTYNWSHNGWTFVSSTATSRTLQPNSGASLPSNVSVTPSINGVAQSPVTSLVSRAPFLERVSIIGPANLCNTRNYSVNTSGITVTNWSISNQNIATITTNGNQVTLSPLPRAEGPLTITANITNACGQTKIITRNIFVGRPLATANTLLWTGIRGVNPVSVWPTNTYRFNVDQVMGANSYTWVLPDGFSVLNGGSTTTTGTSIFITTSATPGTYQLHAYANSQCGGSWTNALIINNGTGTGGGTHPLSVYPNPASHTLIIEQIENLNTDEKFDFEKAKNYSYTIYDFNGRIIEKGNFTNKAKIDVSNLKKGRYILKTKTDDDVVEYNHIMIN